MSLGGFDSVLIKAGSSETKEELRVKEAIGESLGGALFNNRSHSKRSELTGNLEKRRGAWRQVQGVSPEQAAPLGASPMGTLIVSDKEGRYEA